MRRTSTITISIKSRSWKIVRWFDLKKLPGIQADFQGSHNKSWPYYYYLHILPFPRFPPQTPPCRILSRQPPPGDNFRLPLLNRHGRVGRILTRLSFVPATDLWPIFPSSWYRVCSVIDASVRMILAFLRFPLRFNSRSWEERGCCLYLRPQFRPGENQRGKGEGPLEGERGRVPWRRSRCCRFAEVLGFFRAELYRTNIGLGELNMTAWSFRTSLTKWDHLTRPGSWDIDWNVSEIAVFRQTAVFRNLLLRSVKSQWMWCFYSIQLIFSGPTDGT